MMSEALSLRAIKLILEYTCPKYLLKLACVSEDFCKQVRICMITNIKNKLKISENSDEFNHQNLKSLFDTINLEDTNNDLYQLHDGINKMFITADKLLVFTHYGTGGYYHNFRLSFDIVAYIKKDNMFIRYEISEMAYNYGCSAWSHIYLIYSDTYNELPYDKLMHYIKTNDDKYYYNDLYNNNDTKIHCLFTSDINVPILYYSEKLYICGTKKIDTDINKFFSEYSMNYSKIFKTFKTDNDIYTLNSMAKLFEENKYTTLQDELCVKLDVRHF